MDAVGQPHRLTGVVHTIEQQYELVLLHTSDCVHGTHTGLQTLAYLPKDEIPNLAALLLVDLAEVV